jgi:DNA-binding winged helix-turn-helix (wHTH) protein/tetratricopeptide (TPR) repeat protein
MSPAKQVEAALELDLGRYELRRHGRRVKLEKKPIELLIFLVGRKDQLVSRSEIMKKLWRSDLFIDAEPNINNIVRKVRAALGDNPAKPRFLETVVGKGYRFVGPIRVVDAQFRQPDLEVASGMRIQQENLPSRTNSPSLAVIPLVALGNISDDQGLCLGFADGLLSRLANLEGVNVLPTSAVANLPSEMSASEAGARLGVRFVVHGAIQQWKGQHNLSLAMLDTRVNTISFSRRCPLDLNCLPDLEDELARQIAKALNRPLARPALQRRPRYSKDPIAYAEFMRGYKISSSGDSATVDEAANCLSTALARDPDFSLAHAVLSYIFATRHFELDPASNWLEKAEFHCRRALELDPDLAEGHVAKAFLLWGPSRNFQHQEAISELRRALALQNNLPHAYNRLGTILAHIGLLDHAREMYQRGRAFHSNKAVSHSIVQVYLWNFEYDFARDEIQAWHAESPGNKYPLYFAPQLALMTGDMREAEVLIHEALQILPEEPLTLSLQGLFFALNGKPEQSLECVTRACAIPKSFGHAHHTYYQVACILSVLGRITAAFEWLERSVSTGFACWPFFVKDPCLQNLRALPEFELLISSLQAKYPDHLGLL